MNKPKILNLATQLPATRYTQEQVFEHVVSLQNTDERRKRAMRTIFDRAGVSYRHLVTDAEYFGWNRTTEERNNRYMEEAVPLGEAAIRQVLQGRDPGDVDDLTIVSCTGLSVPGLDLLLAGRLGMSGDLQRSCILGMGCYGAFPGLRRAWESVLSQPNRLTLVLALELCSLHFQFDPNSESIVSAALFSDGAAAVLIGRDDENSGPQIIDSVTYCDYSTLNHMSFTVTDHGFRMYLSSYVPDLLAANIEVFADDLLTRNGLSRGDVRFWGVHPGSTKVVDYIQERLGLTDAQVEPSHNILCNYGNMSSATILFVLDYIQKCNHPAPGDYGVLMAFGPGLTMEALLLRW